MDRPSLPADAPPIRPPAGSGTPTDDPAVTVVDGPVIAVVDGPVTVVEDPPPVGKRPPVGTISVVEPAPAVAPEARMLPPHRSKVERVADHVAAISGDLQEWVELKIALVRREILDKIQQIVGAAKLAVPGLVLALVGLLFLLLTLAFAIGDLIGSVWGGFGIVTLLLLAGGAVLLWMAKRAYENPEPSVDTKRPRTNHIPARPAEIAEAERVSARQSAA